MEDHSAHPKPDQRREKVLHPLDPNLTATAAPVITQPVSAHNTTPTLSAYDPSADGHYKTLASKSTSFHTATTRTLAMQHKSLLILAIVGLLSSLFSLFSASQLSELIRQAEIDHSPALDKLQTALAVLYIGIAINVLMNVYFLVAKNRHTLSTVLKILIVLTFISVFGIFWGIAPNNGVAFLIDAPYLLFTYIVYNIVKTPRTL